MTAKITPKRTVPGFCAFREILGYSGVAMNFKMFKINTPSDRRRLPELALCESVIFNHFLFIFFVHSFWAPELAPELAPDLERLRTQQSSGLTHSATALSLSLVGRVYRRRTQRAH